MKILIFGPSGSGKTFLSTECRNLGMNAIDADQIDGLSSWHDKAGNKIDYPEDAGKEFLENHEFLWDRAFLEKYLQRHGTIYLFGGSGNIFEMLDLFDKTFFLHIPPEIQKRRLMHKSRENPMGQTEYQRKNAVRWAKCLEEKARKLNLPFIDATLHPREVLDIIRS